MVIVHTRAWAWKVIRRKPWNIVCVWSCFHWASIHHRWEPLSRCMKTNELPTSTCQDPERLSVRESRIWLTHCSITLLTVWNSSCTCRDSYCMASPASSDKKRRCRTHSSGHSHAAAEKLHKRLWIIHGGHHGASWSAGGSTRGSMAGCSSFWSPCQFLACSWSMSSIIMGKQWPCLVFLQSSPIRFQWACAHCGLKSLWQVSSGSSAVVAHHPQGLVCSEMFYFWMSNCMNEQVYWCS